MAIRMIAPHPGVGTPAGRAISFGIPGRRGKFREFHLRIGPVLEVVTDIGKHLTESVEQAAAQDRFHQQLSLSHCRLS